MKKKNFWIRSGKENVRFPDSPDFQNLPEFHTGRDVRQSPNQRSQYIRPTLKKNSFRGNYSRKYGISLNFSQQRPLINIFTMMTIVKSCCHNFTKSAYFMIFSLSSISYRPTDFILIKRIFQNCPELGLQGKELDSK